MSPVRSTPRGPTRISVEVAGITYRGTYAIDGNTMTIWYRGHKKIGTIGSSEPATFARTMLSKLAREHLDQPDG